MARYRKPNNNGFEGSGIISVSPVLANNDVSLNPFNLVSKYSLCLRFLWFWNDKLIFKEVLRHSFRYEIQSFFKQGKILLQCDNSVTICVNINHNMEYFKINHNMEYFQNSFALTYPNLCKQNWYASNRCWTSKSSSFEYPIVLDTKF